MLQFIESDQCCQDDIFLETFRRHNSDCLDEACSSKQMPMKTLPLKQWLIHVD